MTVPLDEPRLAIDVGGTFTDVALRFADGRVWRTKIPTQIGVPAESIRAVLDALPDDVPPQLRHVLLGSTLGTNALVEGKLPRVGLLTTSGFRDVLQFRRLRRTESLYSLSWQPPQQIIPRDLILEVDERIGADGAVVTPLLEDELERILAWVADASLDSLAVCLINAPANPDHERLIDERLGRQLGVPITLSSDVDPTTGEYERTSTTVIHAALKPVLGGYLASVNDGLKEASSSSRLYVMQSSGGLAASDQIVAEPARAIESGPAAGALFAGAMAERAGLDRAVSFDMGGTTAKACLLEHGRPAEADALWVGEKGRFGEGFSDRGGYVVRGQTVDIVEVGAGGGSICSVDPAGVLHVGPMSAGSNPGPAAYGRGGDLPTVTDADLVLGFLEPATAAGITLDHGRATAAIGRHVADSLAIPVEEAAWLIHEVANSNMRRAIEAVTSDRGRDPVNYSLIAFGGAGPTHAAGVARALGMREVLVPESADAFSAVGLHECEIRRDVIHAYRRGVDEVDQIALMTEYERLEEQMALAVVDAPVDAQLQQMVDVRFDGQASSLTIDLPDVVPEKLGTTIANEFIASHLREYGHATEGSEVEIVALRLRLLAGFGKGETRPVPGPSVPPRAARAYFGPLHGWSDCIRVSPSDLAGSATPGPLLVQLGQATAVVPPDATASVDEAGQLRISLPESVSRRHESWAGRSSLQLFKNALGAVVDRMAYTVARTAFSQTISETHDFAVGICDESGRVVAQDLGILLHLTTLASGLEEIYKSDLPPLQDDDVVVLNDPYAGGTHLPDVAVVVPVFLNGALIAHTVAVGHMVDIGGVEAGSLTLSSAQLRNEGLILPPLRLYDRGILNESVVKILRRNIRQPREVLGDLEALVAAARTGNQRIKRLASEVGVESFLALVGDLQTYVNERAREEIAGLGNAEAEFTDYVDDDGVSDTPIKLHAKLRLDEGEVYCDLSGCSPQVRSGINSVRGTTRSVLQWAIRTQLSDDFPDNHGLLSLLHLTTVPGTVVDASDDAPVVARSVIAFRLADCLQGALAKMFPERIPAIGDSLHPVSISGRRQDGSTFVVHDNVGGTSGASPSGDGIEGVTSALANARNVSVELLEANTPVRVRRVGFLPGDWRVREVSGRKQHRSRVRDT